MKSLNDYTDKAVSELFEAKGAFFAFGKTQFDEKKKEGITYVDMAGGLVCPKENADSLSKELSAIYKDGKKQYLAENKIEDIIRYELANHECYYTGDWMVAYYIVEEYGAIGGGFVVLLYLILFFRAVKIMTRIPGTFGAFLSIGVAFSLVFQAMINMGVAVNLLPVTGQPLPLISMGGTSIWFTSLAIGIILSVSKELEKKQDPEKNKLNKAEPIYA